MVIFSIKKIEQNILNKTITPKQFIIYSLFTLGSFYSLFRTSKYPVNIEAYNIAFILSFVPIIIECAKYFFCYKIIKEKDIFTYLYAIIPVNFVLYLRYLLLLIIPLTILNIYLIKYLNLDFTYWNVINSQIVTIIYHIVISIELILIMKRLYRNI